LCGIYVEGSASGSDDDHDRHDAAEEETDDEDDDDEFLDTQDFLSSSSFKSAESEFQKTPYDSDEDEGPLDIEDGMDSCIKFVGSNYPCVMRRKKLPDPVEKEKGVSLWSMIKDNIGKDLTRVCLPVYFNEPISSLQKCFEDLEYSFLLDRAYEFGKMVGSSFLVVSYPFLIVDFKKTTYLSFSQCTIAGYKLFGVCLPLSFTIFETMLVLLVLQKQSYDFAYLKLVSNKETCCLRLLLFYYSHHMIS
jgi:hypothetical protein